MVNATGGATSTDPINFSFTQTTNNSPTMDSFAQQLATAIEGYIGKSGHASSFQVEVQGGPQNNGSGQFTVTVKNLATTTPASSAAVVSSSSSTPAADPATIDKSGMTPTDAYWADQPPAVQALRDAPNDQRYAMAQDLSKQGYAIDMPIMVWGWDPLVTMTLRQNEGYTWVPSAFQSNIPIGPGVTNVWNLPAYDPNQPPPGSIKVSTDFAKGSNGQDPWMKMDAAT